MVGQVDGVWIKSVKAELQKISSLERSIESILEKMSILEKSDQLIQGFVDRYKTGAGAMRETYASWGIGHGCARWVT